MNQYLVSGVTGAAPIWNDIMTKVLVGKKAEWPDKPKGIIDKQICSVSGLLPNPDAPCGTRTEFFWEGTEPTEIEHLQKETWINPVTGIPPKEGESTDGLNLETKSLLSDPFTFNYCLDCTRPVVVKGKTQWEQYTVDLQKYYAEYDLRKDNPAATSKPPEGGAQQ
jgi:hypothetical protein